MGRDAEDIRDLIDHNLPGIYEAIGRGETHNECLDFSSEIYELLASEGEDVIMVQSREKNGEPLHHFLLWREDGTGAPVMIDPTLNQLFPEYEDVYIGTRDQLREEVLDNYDYHSEKEEVKAHKTFNRYWPDTLHIDEPEDIYIGEPHGHYSPPLEMDPSDFQDKWNAEGEFKVIQSEEFTRALLPNDRYKKGTKEPVGGGSHLLR